MNVQNTLSKPPSDTTENNNTIFVIKKIIQERTKNIRTSAPNQGMKYAPYEQQIITIIKQEIGFTPRLSVRFFRDFEQFKIKQRAIDSLLLREYISNDEVRSLESQLKSLDHLLLFSLIESDKNVWNVFEDIFPVRKKSSSQKEKKDADKQEKNLSHIRIHLMNEIPVLE